MEERKYQREEGRNNAERAYLPKGKLESLFASEENNLYYYQLKYRGNQNE